MESMELREAIRMNYAIGRLEGENRLTSIKADHEYELLKLEGARRMTSTIELSHSQAQGFWHTISDEPLSIVVERLGENSNV